MIEDKLTKALKDAGIKFNILHLELTPEDKRRDKEIRKYVMEIEKAHENAEKKKSNILYKEYSTNTYSPFPFLNN